ncbi:MAG: 1-phosphofructokinase family hexose kinase [Kosmotoga sp.]|nr:MAG: 1-phosphofructokinase family hexose kinase [Kosmotoga sp.]
MILTLTMNPCLDRYYYIDTLKEDDTIRVNKMIDYPAGKGIDISRAINEMRGHSVAITLLGGDTGRQIMEMLDKEGVVYSTVNLNNNTRTNLILQTKENQFRFSVPGSSIDKTEEKKVIKNIETLLRKGDYLLIAGSIPEGLPDDFYYKIINNANKIGAKVYFDADNKLLLEGVKASPNGIKPNLHEFSRLIDNKLNSEEQIIESLKETSERYSIKEILLTMGKDGAICFIEGSIFKVSVPKVKVDSSVGAGDTFLGVYCMYREMDREPEHCLKMAGAASSAATMTSGTKLCKYDDVMNLIDKVFVERI